MKRTKKAITKTIITLTFITAVLVSILSVKANTIKQNYNYNKYKNEPVINVVSDDENIGLDSEQLKELFYNK